MIRPTITVVLAMGLGIMPTVSRAALVDDSPTTVSAAEQLDAIFADAQRSVTRFNTEGNLEELARARGLLLQWLEQHHALYGDTEAAEGARGSVREQLSEIDAHLEARRPVPVVPAPVVPLSTLDPPPDSASPVYRPDRGLMIGGTVMAAVGAVVLLTGSLPLLILRNNALDNADAERFEVNEQRYIRRARRRHAGAVTTAVVGSALAGSGLVMIAVGSSRRNRPRAELSLAPRIGRDQWGAGALMRF